MTVPMYVATKSSLTESCEIVNRHTETYLPTRSRGTQYKKQNYPPIIPQKTQKDYHMPKDVHHDDPLPETSNSSAASLNDPEILDSLRLMLKKLEKGDDIFGHSTSNNT